jgi:hypothetical protein
MNRSRARVYLVGALALGLSACGGAGEDGPLAAFTGWWDVGEQFVSETGTQCLGAPVLYFSNRLDLRIDGTSLELRFRERWGTLVGQVTEEAGSMLANRQVGGGETLRFTGSLVRVAGPPEELSLTGQMTQSTTGCNRIYALTGLRPATP